MKGRKAKPAEVKAAQGNPGRRPIHHAPDLPGLSLQPPKDLPAAARRIWEALAPELSRLKLLRATDLGAFARYCEHLARWAELTKALRKSGETYVTQSAHGTMRRIDPNFMVRDRIEGRLHELEDRFGLTPMARQQLLQKLAIAPLPQTPAGNDLFGTQPEGEAPDAPPAPATLPPSPVGLLNRGRLN
jgi:P27 family predicted phage terminase small subunit